MLDRKLRPDNLTTAAKSLSLSDGKGTCFYMFNPMELSFSRKGTSLCIGSLIKPGGEWWLDDEKPANTPLWINNQGNILLISADILGSRTLWYYFDKDLFICSTSQRAIIIYLQSFQYNPQAASWMLATGCLGPGYAWDKRLKSLGPGGRIRLNKRHWDLTHSLTQVNFKESDEGKSVLKKKLGFLLEESFSKININLSAFALTLSGGCDSRAIAYYLNKKVNTISWGLQDSILDEKTDAYIAKQVAEKLQLPHHFYGAEAKLSSFEKKFNRFLRAGEGRVDHIQTYTDGLDMWRKLNEQGIRGVIRGDETFGWLPVQNEKDARLSVSFNKMEDFVNLKRAEEYGIEPQVVPGFYERREDESIPCWRDRLYQQYRITYIQTALHDVVYPYVELVNPLLMDDLVKISQILPAKYRTSKKLYTEIVRELLPNIPFAAKPSVPETEDFVKDPFIAGMIREEISSIAAKQYLSPELIQWVTSTMIMKAHKEEQAWKFRFRNAVPFRVKKMLRHTVAGYKVDSNQLAFRNYLVIQSVRMLEEDSKTLE